MIATRVHVRSFLASAFMLVSFAGGIGHEQHAVERPSPKLQTEDARRRLPPLPKGVAELKFSDFFVYPVGDCGLQLTPKFLGLAGKRVRILGYMVQQGEPSPGVFLLAPVPVQTHEEEYGLCDDLPPSVLHVFVPIMTDEVVPYTPGLMLLTGTLEVGNRSERDGRNSIARLLLDRPAKGRKSRGFALTKGAEKLSAQTRTLTPTKETK